MRFALLTAIRRAACAVTVLVVAGAGPAAGRESQDVRVRHERAQQIREADLREWLGDLASDSRRGRQVFTEEYDSAADYVADHLKAWRVAPLGDNGTYFQAVWQRGYRVTSRSSVVVELAGQTRRFRDGLHVTFPAESGGRQRLVFKGVEFVGYGRVNTAVNHDDFAGRNVKGRLVVWMVGTPRVLVGASAGVGGQGGGAYAVGTRGAAAAVGLVATPIEAGRPARQSVDDRSASGPADFVTVSDVRQPVAPEVFADQTFCAFLFEAASRSCAEMQARAARGDSLDGFSVPDATVTFEVDARYELVSARATKNVVGLIPGSDPVLKERYLFLAAHLDHVGVAPAASGEGPSPGACRMRGREALDALTRAGRSPQRQQAATAPTDPDDRIYNGADDDGSGVVGLMSIARAFAEGPPPRRSVILIWHAGEESGQLGSRYNAEVPVRPLDRAEALFNLDMIGRDDCDNTEGDYRNAVFVVGADRVSTDLHNIIVSTNAAMAEPMTLDFELNDPADPENLYTRSDHVSYAARGVPVAFFTTGLHPDYHRVSDTVDKIQFRKMTRLLQMIYEASWAVANRDRPLERDNRGPRAGFGAKADILTK